MLSRSIHENLCDTVMRKSHCLITVFFHSGLVLRSLFRVFFVHRARLACLALGPGRTPKIRTDYGFHVNFFSFGTARKLIPASSLAIATDVCKGRRQGRPFRTKAPRPEFDH